MLAESAINSPKGESLCEEIISRCIGILTKTERQWRILNFMGSLCHCNGKGVRPIQWTIRRMLLEEASFVLPRLAVRSKAAGQGAAPVIVLSGDPKYFPAFGETGEVELAEFYRRGGLEATRYLERYIVLCSQLCIGRNNENAPAVQALLPLDVVLAIVTSSSLAEEFPSLAAVRTSMASATRNARVRVSYSHVDGLRPMAMHARQ